MLTLAEVIYINALSPRSRLAGSGGAAWREWAGGKREVGRKLGGNKLSVVFDKTTSDTDKSDTGCTET
jgi:hypothetical protein